MSIVADFKQEVGRKESNEVCYDDRMVADNLCITLAAPPSNKNVVLLAKDGNEIAVDKDVESHFS